MGYHDLDRAFLLFWDGFRLYARLNFAVDKVLDEGSNILLSQLPGLVEGEFLILDGLLDGKRRPFIDFEVQVASVSAKCLGVNGCEADSSLMLLSNGL